MDNGNGLNQVADAGDDGSSGSSNTGLYVTLAVAGTLLVVGAIAAAYFFYFKPKARPPPKEVHVGGELSVSSTAQPYEAPLSLSSAPKTAIDVEDAKI